MLRRRGLAVGALVASVALLAPSSAVAGPGSAPAHRVRNQAPSLPAEVKVADPAAECVSGRRATPAAVRSTTPSLAATLADPDGEAVGAVVTITSEGRGPRVRQRLVTAPQASGSTHVVQVPDGLLHDGRTYEWRVQARDAAGRTGAAVRCRITVDVTPPAPPEVRAVEGAPAVYLEDQTAGGVGLTGHFLLDAGASTDVVAFAVSFDGSGAYERVDVPAGETTATLTWTPTSAGPHSLDVQAVDAAGNVSATRFYRFTVASATSTPGGAGTWTLDEGTGTTSADTGPSASHLTLTPSTTWTDGLLAELAGLSEDRALLFDEPTDGAATAGPVVDPAGSFSVLALVRVDAAGALTAVSQDGRLTSAFRLGTRTDGCADGAASCWAFTVSATQPGNPRGVDVVARSAAAVVPGEWVLLAGVRDAVQGTVRVDVCRIGTPEELQDPEVVAGAPVAIPGAAAAAGPLRLGAAQTGQSWAGAVSGVRTVGGVVDQRTSLRMCMTGA
ncbi:hypothetical protein [Cellulomonas sp.]|uniref:hypothetical protein n=1 Tax=Cellulomonas sp. TaxID=40001 RepID=UPI00281276B4|nr:hypothetical protein [Cellulomonas sp.]